MTDSPKNSKQYIEAGRFKILMKYAVIVEKGESSFGAYVPDLPGCVAVSENRAEVLQLIKEAIEFHIEGLHESGEVVPEPSLSVEYIQVLAA